jgi:hypothetical protein
MMAIAGYNQMMLLLSGQRMSKLIQAVLLNKVYEYIGRYRIA